MKNIDLIDELITINHYLLKAISNDDKKSAIKWKSTLDSLLKTFISDENGKQSE